jgi:hypothetical protein
MYKEIYMEKELQDQTQVNGTETTDQAQPAPANDLNINDLAAMKSIIDIASSRGAFKPNEMMAVGQTYNKLSAFLEAVTKGATNGA